MFNSLKKFIRSKLHEGYLPCYVISKQPLVLFAYDSDFVSNADNFIKKFKEYSQIHLFLQLGWQHETAKVAEPFARKLQSITATVPQLSITVLANSPKEVEVLTQLGIKTIFCHQNAFINEHKYHIIKDSKKTFDAIYIARITPFKRHKLCEKISSLWLIGDCSDKEKSYAQNTLKQLKVTRYSQSVSGKNIYKAINQCHCGLCLSSEEGAMFVSAEYLLCGVPIVNTPNIGGRDYLFPPFAVKTVNDTPEDVARGVQEWSATPPDPSAVRNATLEKMYHFRKIFLELMQQVLPQHNFEQIAPEKFFHHFPHKLGLRCSRMPWTNYFHGLKKN